MALTRNHIAPILVIGATGNVGSLTLDDRLLAQLKRGPSQISSRSRPKMTFP